MPCVFVVVVCAPCRAGPVAVTLAPGRTAPLSSTIVPWMLPVEPAPPWARASVGSNNTAIARSEKLRFFTEYLLGLARRGLSLSVAPPGCPKC